ncbi:uncharacterized protein LOC119996704 isoform X2 [Tripterygium wilfordii]|uniref:uncharacterized protein LOC119996704 isoform X2 n=1 Tax=Tripterygium wilfordii TaxID=458696 RepID=UPI0018F82384|nr:uncharacterized protein LOC119996704 isoform X2 [Tripterygium wilfordii]
MSMEHHLCSQLRFVCACSVPCFRYCAQLKIKSTLTLVLGYNHSLPKDFLSAVTLQSPYFQGAAVGVGSHSSSFRSVENIFEDCGGRGADVVRSLSQDTMKLELRQKRCLNRSLKSLRKLSNIYQLLTRGSLRWLRS